VSAFRPTRLSWNGKNYFEATVLFTTFRDWEIGPGDYSGWFPLFTYVPEYIDGPNPAWDWELSTQVDHTISPGDPALVAVYQEAITSETAT
jgi:hypothetical protein